MAVPVNQTAPASAEALPVGGPPCRRAFRPELLIFRRRPSPQKGLQARTLDPPTIPTQSEAQPRPRNHHQCHFFTPHRHPSMRNTDPSTKTSPINPHTRLLEPRRCPSHRRRCVQHLRRLQGRGGRGAIRSTQQPQPCHPERTRGTCCPSAAASSESGSGARRETPIPLIQSPCPPAAAFHSSEHLPPSGLSRYPARSDGVVRGYESLRKAA